MIKSIIKNIYINFINFFDKFFIKKILNKNLNTKQRNLQTKKQNEIDLSLLEEHTRFLENKFTKEQQEDYLYYISSYRRRSLLYFLNVLSNLAFIGKYFRKIYLLSFTETFWNRLSYHEILRARNQGYFKNPIEEDYLRKYSESIIDNEFILFRGFWAVTVPLWLRDFYNYVLYLLTCRHEYYFFRHVRDRWHRAFPPGSEWRDWSPEILIFWGIWTLILTPIETTIVVTATIVYYQIKVPFILISTSYRFLKEMLVFLYNLNKEILKFLYLNYIKLIVNVLAANRLLGQPYYNDGILKKKIIPGIQFTKFRMIPDYFGSVLYQGPVIELPIEKEFYDEVVEFIDKDNIKVFGNTYEIKFTGPFDFLVRNTRYKEFFSRLNLVAYFCAYPFSVLIYYFCVIVFFGMFATSQTGKYLYLDEVYYTFGNFLKLIKNLIEQQAILQCYKYEQTITLNYQNHYENFIQYLNKILIIGYHLITDGNGKFLEIFQKDFFSNLKQRLIHLYGPKTDPWYFPISPDVTTARFIPTIDKYITDEMCVNAYYLFVEERLKPSDFHFFRSAYQSSNLLKFWDKDWSFENFDYFGNKITNVIPFLKFLKKPFNSLFEVVRKESLTEYRYIIPEFFRPKNSEHLNIKCLTEAEVRSFLIENPVKELMIDPNFLRIVRVDFNKIFPSTAHLKFNDLFTGEVYYFNKNDVSTIFFPEEYRENLFLKILPNIKLKASTEFSLFSEIQSNPVFETELLQFINKSSNPLIASFQDFFQILFGLFCFLPYQLIYVDILKNNIISVIFIIFLFFVFFLRRILRKKKNYKNYFKNIVTLALTCGIFLPILIFVLFPIYILKNKIKRQALQLKLTTTKTFNDEIKTEIVQENITNLNKLAIQRKQTNMEQNLLKDRQLIIDLTYPKPKYYRDRDAMTLSQKKYIKRTKYPFEERTFEHFIRRPELYFEMFYNKEYYWRYIYELIKVIPELMSSPETNLPLELKTFSFVNTFSENGFNTLKQKINAFQTHTPNQTLVEEFKITPEELFGVRLALKRLVLLQKFNLYAHPNRAMVWDNGRILEGLAPTMRAYFIKHYSRKKPQKYPGSDFIKLKKYIFYKFINNVSNNFIERIFYLLYNIKNYKIGRKFYVTINKLVYKITAMCNRIFFLFVYIIKKTALTFRTIFAKNYSIKVKRKFLRIKFYLKLYLSSTVLGTYFGINPLAKKR
jgi:hypothetical protein